MEIVICMSVKEELVGFKFQYHTVLVFFLDRPKYFTSLASEKLNEDCVLKTTDGKYWFIQCKFSSKRDKPNKNLMSKGLVDLKEHQKENVERLILATNIYNPFCSKSLFLPRSCLDIKSFNELHSYERKKLNDYVKVFKSKPKMKNKPSKNDVEELFSYAYLNYDMPTTIEANSNYLVEKIKEFICTNSHFSNVSVRSVANSWLRIVENEACKLSLTNDDELIDKGCLAGAFCNCTLFQHSFIEISQKYNFQISDIASELLEYCDEYKDFFIDEAIDSSYSIWSDFLQFKNSYNGDLYQCRHEYINGLCVNKKMPSFIIESFQQKGEERESYQLQIYKYFVACVIENSELILEARREFGCDY